MQEADGWFMCRIGFVETARALVLASGRNAVERFREEWSAFGVVEIDQPLVEHAAELAAVGALRSLDALHLAAAMVLPRAELSVATWDRRLHQSAAGRGLSVLPERLD